MPARTATLYRLPDCPYGKRAKQMLDSSGFEVEDNVFESRDEAQRFQREHNVETTPQVFIAGERIGGSDDLERYLQQQNA